MNDAVVGQRLHGLDFLRALMMSLGVVLHAAQFYITLPIADYYWDPARSVSMDALLIYINTFRMPTFYLLSGFFCALLLQRRGMAALMANRRARVLLPFLLFLPPLAGVMTVLRIIAANLSATGQAGFDPAHVSNPAMLWNNTHNLWFLYYLLMFIGTVAALAWLGARWPGLARLGARCQQASIAGPVVTVLAALLLALVGSTSDAGRISANLSFVPDPAVYLYFLACFGLGWLLYQRLDDLAILARRAWWLLLAAHLALVAGLACFALQGQPAEAHYGALHAGLSLATGFSMVFFMQALVGLFSRYATGYSARVRYFSDSAYWVFIFHSIPQVAIALLLYHWAVPAELKFLMVLVTSFAISLLTYDLWIRDGAIGALLNGRRYPSRLRAQSAA